MPVLMIYNGVIERQCRVVMVVVAAVIVHVYME